MSGDGLDDRGGDERTEYDEWKLPGQSGGNGPPEDDGEAPTPPKMRTPLFRDRLRDRLGVTPRQWYVVETILLVLPYPFFVAAYLAFDVNEMLFLAVTLAYSLVATYVGILS